MDLRVCVASELNPPLNVELVTTREGLDRAVSFAEGLEEFGLDLETNMVPSFYDRRIRTIQIGNREKQYVIDLLAFADHSDDLYSSLGGNPRGKIIYSSGLEYVRSKLAPVLEDYRKIKVGHNLAFEYETLKWNFGIRICGLHDTFITEKVLKSGLVNFKMSNYWALDDLVARYCGLKISKVEQTSFNLHDPLTQSQIDYAALDTRLPIAIKGAQVKKIEALNLQRCLKIENDAIPSFADMHLNGMLINEDRWEAEIKKTWNLHDKNVAILDELFIPVVGLSKRPYSEQEERLCEKFWREEKDKEQRANYRKTFYAMRREISKWEKDKDKYEGKAAVQYGSPKQLLEALHKAGVKIPNTNDEVLETLEGNKFIDAVREYRTTAKILDSYSDYISKYQDPNTKRIHAIFDQLGAETGRTSSRNPNMQNISKGSEWRNCFIARPGKKIITADYSGCELRILAEVSGEEVWIEAFNKGWDVHSLGAEMIYGEVWKQAALPNCAYYADGAHAKCKCPEHKKLRNYIKSINFGIAYGMEARKLARQIKVEVEIAQELLIKYRSTFKKVTAWLAKAGKDAQMMLKSYTLAGRIRFYLKPDWAVAKQFALEDATKAGKPLTQRLIDSKYRGMFASIERQGKNSPIQGTNADMVKLAVGAGYGVDGQSYMWQELETKYDAYLLSSVHDECVVECNEDNAEEVYAFVTGCMYRAGNEFLTKIKAEVDGHINDYWDKGE